MTNNSYFINRLAPETRLQIYEHLFSFYYPLKHVKPIKKRKRLSFKHDDNKGGKRVNMSILGTCRKVYHEAIEIFYKRNIISLSHADVCLDKPWSLQKTSMQLLEHAEATLNIAGADYAGCRACRNDTLLLEHIFDRRRFPQLQTVKVCMGWVDGNIVDADKALHKAYTTTYTAVGSFEVIGTRTRTHGLPKIEVEYTNIRKAWRYLTNHRSPHELFPKIEEARNALPDVPVKLLRQMGRVLYFARLRHSFLPYGYNLPGSYHGIPLTLLYPYQQSEEVYRKLTGGFLCLSRLN